MNGVGFWPGPHLKQWEDLQNRFPCFATPPALAAVLPCFFAAFDTPSTSGNAMDVDMESPMNDEGGPWRIASNRRTVKSVNRRRQEKMEEQGILTEQDNPSSLPFG